MTKQNLTDDEDLDDFPSSQTMLSLIKSMQATHMKINLDLLPQNKTMDANKGNIIQLLFLVR